MSDTLYSTIIVCGACAGAVLLLVAICVARFATHRTASDEDEKE
jgi:hypothetical protein